MKIIILFCLCLTLVFSDSRFPFGPINRLWVSGSIRLTIQYVAGNQNSLIIYGNNDIQKSLENGQLSLMRADSYSAPITAMIQVSTVPVQIQASNSAKVSALNLPQAYSYLLTTSGWGSHIWVEQISASILNIVANDFSSIIISKGFIQNSSVSTSNSGKVQFHSGVQCTNRPNVQINGGYFDNFARVSNK